MGALLLSLDNAQVAVSRFILLDTPLIFFTLLALYCALRFASHRQATGCPMMSRAFHLSM
jgi:dolichyl-phosphate-mannose--protein O-mannosyl transferase